MNFAELSRGTKVLLVAGLLLLIDSFLAWQQVSVGAGNFHVTASASMWHGVGVVAGCWSWHCSSGKGCSWLES